MTRIASVLLCLPLLAATAAAQLAPVPTITSVAPRKAYAPDTVTLVGTNLGLVTDVRVNGVSVPIVRSRATRLVVGPLAPQDPGFGTIEAAYGRGTVHSTLPLLPTLTATRRYLHLDVVLDNGDTGTYVLRHSYTVLGSAEIDQGIYGKRFLRPYASLLSAGVFTSSGPLEIDGILIPLQVGLIGARLGLQAECYAATSGVTSYTNLAIVPGLGEHQ